MNDGDSLDVAYRRGSEQEMVDFLRWLGLQPVIYERMPEQPVAGVSYQLDRFSQFPSLIPDTQWIKQPGHCEVSRVKVFIWCGRDDIKLSVSSLYVVTEDDVKRAETLERKLVNSPLSVIDPPIDTEHYICPRYYPEYFG